MELSNDRVYRQGMDKFLARLRGVIGAMDSPLRVAIVGGIGVILGSMGTALFDLVMYQEKMKSDRLMELIKAPTEEARMDMAKFIHFSKIEVDADLSAYISENSKPQPAVIDLQVIERLVAASVAPEFSISDDGNIQITFNTIRGLTYTIYETRDLQEWTTVKTLIAHGDTRQSWETTFPKDDTAVFYKIAVK